MSRDLDIDAINAIKLDDDAVDSAVEAATQAFVAGGEEHEQLTAGLKAYLWHIDQDRAVPLLKGCEYPACFCAIKCDEVGRVAG